MSRDQDPPVQESAHPDAPGDSWEERMAARTAQRRRVGLPENREPGPYHDAALNAATAEFKAGITLGRATAILRPPHIACACPGPPGCCIDAYDQARLLRRAAHISVKLFDDLRRRS